MSRRSQALFIGLFLLIIYGVPVSQAVIEVWRGHMPQALDLFSTVPRKEALRTYEKDLERSSIYAEGLRPWMQYLTYVVLRSPGEKAILGRDGWLFYRPDVQYLVEAAQADPLAAILTFQRQLSSRGIRLMVIPMPGKPSIYSDKLTYRASFRSPTRDLIARLRAAGVETPDLFELFHAPPEPYYLILDTHWSGSAARLAADAVGRRIHDLGWINPGSAEYGVKPVLVKRRGDIIRMMKAPELEREFPPEEVRCEQVIAANGELYKDDPHSPVLVLGDSFMRIYEKDEPGSAGFIAHLARVLHAPLASIVNDGGASTLVRQELARKAELLDGKKLVIWEFVERDIRFGTEGWKDVPLPGPATPPAGRGPI
jgi:SGNH hydrolase-like domain, acetyltransferase AlgX